MENQKKFTVRDLAEIGVLAALVFVATYFLKIGPIPTPAGPTQLKMGNAVCLLGAMLFGKTKGGLAAGIGVGPGHARIDVASCKAADLFKKWCGQINRFARCMGATRQFGPGRVGKRQEGGTP